MISNRQHAVPVSPRYLARAAERTLVALGRTGARIEVALVDDGEIRRLNRAWRGVSRRTDVLAFPLETLEIGGLVGEVLISAETAARQARCLGVPVAAELELLVTHGVLHLAGYDDRDPVEAGLMHERERQILRSRGRRVPARLWKGLLRA
ncbi:MAG TPA: rRNA maturation RNase YbeY [Methylomirabilota bacterium]|nr:rRNA maturation RNase YbeY [Methylomirabilota bacterium]